MDEWLTVAVFSLVAFGVVFILVASSSGHEVDGTTVGAFVTLAVYLVTQLIVRRRSGGGRHRDNDE